MKNETQVPIQPKRAWVKPSIEALSVSDAMLRLMRSHQPTSTALQEMDGLSAPRSIPRQVKPL